MKELVAQIIKDSSSLKEKLSQDAQFISGVVTACDLLARAIGSSNTIYACGNGGSTCDAMHLVEELVGRYKRDRRGFKAQHLMDSSIMTCWGNDVGFNDAFRRCVETFCSPGDVLIGISTSGKSQNVISAVTQAKSMGISTIGLLGKDGGELRDLCDVSLVVPSQQTERIQEVHITVIHTWLELLETKYGLV